MAKLTKKKSSKSLVKVPSKKTKGKTLKKPVAKSKKPITGKAVPKKTVIKSRSTSPLKSKNEKENVHTKEEEDLYAAEEQGILKEKDSDEMEAFMEHGELDEDVYSKEGRKKLEEDEEIDPWEEGFMQGAEQAGQLGKDALTGEPLMDVEDVVEEEIDGKMYRFVNEKNARKFRLKKELEAEEED